MSSCHASKQGWAALAEGFFGVCLCLEPAGQAVGLGLLCGEHAPRGSQQRYRTHRASTQAARVYVRDIISFDPAFYFLSSTPFLYLPWSS